MNNQTEEVPKPTIQDLYPLLSGAALKEAEENLDQYLESTLRLYERISADPVAYERFHAALTARRNRSTMDDGRSNPSAR